MSKLGKQHRSQSQPLFDFSKISKAKANKPSKRASLNASINTCPLTLSHLTVDSADLLSIRSSGSSSGSNMSNASQPTTGDDRGYNDNGSHHNPISNGYPGPGGGGVDSRICHRNSSNNDASWPAESPDPFHATARWGTQSSPPTSSHVGPAHPMMMAIRGGVTVAGVDPQDNNQPHQLYRPIRRQQLSTGSATSSSASPSAASNNNKVFAVPTKKGKQDVSSFPSHSLSSYQISKRRQRRSSFATPLHPLHATIVFVDLEGYSKSSDTHQRHLTCDFMNTLRNLLTFAYDELPVRGNIDNYVILPTGDGAAVIVIRPPRRTNTEKNDSSNNNCKDDGCSIHEDHASHLPQDGISCSHCSTQSLRTTEETALWIGSSLLLWASRRQIGLRVGLNSGELSIVEDPYGDPNVCGDAINMAARIMDTALPGQILASASTVVPNLNVLLAEEMAVADLMGAYEDGDELDGHHHGSLDSRRKQDCTHCTRIKFEISSSASEVVVKHGVTTNVQSITCALHLLPRPEDLPPELQPTESPMAPPTSSSRAQTDSKASSGEHSLLNPLARLRKNPLITKLSFASLSSLQMGGGSSNSLRGSRGSMRKLSSCTKQSGPQRNASWKLSGSSNSQIRMSMLSQSSEEDNNPSSKTLTASNTTTSIQQQVPTQQAVQQHVGNHRTPATKWYMKIKPTEMQSSSNNQIKPKVLPQELIRRHRRIAFLGIMHDNLSRGFVNILKDDPSHRWEQVYILFPSDECLKNHLAKNYRDQSVENLIYNKQECRKTLEKLLSQVVQDLRFLQYDQLMHCGSYWDWKDPGGFIHISPLTWGANPKTCPAMNYYWNSRVPSPEYRVYNDGLEYLLETATPFDEIVSLEDGASDTIREDQMQ